jgi:hypothetical protein
VGPAHLELGIGFVEEVRLKILLFVSAVFRGGTENGDAFGDLVGRSAARAASFVRSPLQVAPARGADEELGKERYGRHVELRLAVPRW